MHESNASDGEQNVADHGHAHAHEAKYFGTAFAIGTALNVVYVVAQVTFGLVAHSLVLIADAAHNFGTCSVCF